MRQKFNIRTATGTGLAFATVIMVLLSWVLPDQEKLNQSFTHEVDRIHRETLSRLSKVEDFPDIKLAVPVFIYDLNDSLIFWNDERLPSPDNFLTGKDSISLFSHKDIQGLIFQNRIQDLITYIYIPVTGYKNKSTTLSNLPVFSKNLRQTTLTYRRKFSFNLTEKTHKTHSELFGWFIILMITSSFILLKTRLKSLIKHFPGSNKPAFASLLVPAMFALCILLLDVLNVLPGGWLLTSHFIPQYLPVSPLSIILLEILGIYFISSVDLIPLNTGKINISGKVIGLFLFFSIGMIATLTLNFTGFLYLNANENFNLDRLFSVNFEEIVVLLILLFFFILSVYLILKIYKNIHQLKVNTQSKISYIGATILVLFIFELMDWIWVPFIPFLLGFLILIVLLDLYFDRKSFSSNWLVTWMIVISSFLSFIIFYTDLQKDLSERQKDLNQILFDRDQKTEQYILGQSKNILSSQNSDTVNIPEAGFGSLMDKMAKITDSLYFDPLSGSYFSLLKNNKLTGFRTVLLVKNQNLKEKNVPNTEFILADLQKNWIDTPENHFPETDSIWNKKGYSYVSHSNDSGYAIMSSQKIPGLLRPVSLIAALFFVISIGLFSLSMLDAKLKILPKDIDLSFFLQKSLRSRIQLSILSLTVIAFIIAGFVSAGYFKKIYTLQNEEIVKANANALQSELQPAIDKIPAHAKHTCTFILPVNQQDYDFYITPVSKRNTGSVLQKFPSEDVILRIPYNQFHNQLIDSCTHGKNNFIKASSGIFTPLKFTEGTKHFIYSPTRFNHGLQSKISDLLGTFLSIYAVLFILSVVIAIGLSNSITNPIDILGQKLKGLKLSRKNETVEWQNEDEIGALITIYNEMIIKLGDNARLMAKIERDSAWKEMAQQVAHEIKNPLTPLKLNIQYLESKVGSNPELAPQLIAQLAPSLIEQIDNLSQIASEFSNFAQLPDARNEKLNLNDIVKKVHDFFRKREDMSFKLTLPINDVLVFADKNHMVRILNNVIKNAIQAIPEDRPGQISIDLYRQESNAVIKVSDNGTGIPEDMREKVFSPNFTTKSSGTGLGLAIAINMLESFGGRIYFETIENEGSDFFIEIPLMRFEDNFPQANKVFLED
ncbi:MAG TPA: hypothetical protein DCX89_07000 [Saprospirales bacterium]|nr:hypothetical protein [Saprospirales bacterium]HRQ29233.1 ATP-binding protein [Saprospiraceae bacterium]